jgi:hypothetical protein
MLGMYMGLGKGGSPRERATMQGSYGLRIFGQD